MSSGRMTQAAILKKVARLAGMTAAASELIKEIYKDLGGRDDFGLAPSPIQEELFQADGSPSPMAIAPPPPSEPARAATAPALIELHSTARDFLVSYGRNSGVERPRLKSLLAKGKIVTLGDLLAAKLHVVAAARGVGADTLKFIRSAVDASGHKFQDIKWYALDYKGAAQKIANRRFRKREAQRRSAS